MGDRRDMEIVRLRQLGETCGQIGEKFGITDSRVSQIYRQWLLEQNKEDGQHDNGLFHRMVELSDMKKADGRPSHIPSAAYISIRRYWETEHPGELPTIDDLCRMTEREVAGMPNIGEGPQAYIRDFKRDAIRERVRRELQDVSSEVLLPSVREGRLADSPLRTAVYLRVAVGGMSQSGARELLEPE